MSDPTDPNCGGTYVSRLPEQSQPQPARVRRRQSPSMYSNLGDETLLCLRPADTRAIGLSISVSENARCTTEITLRVVDPALSAAPSTATRDGTEPSHHFDMQLPPSLTPRSSDADNTLSFAEVSLLCMTVLNLSRNWRSCQCNER